jgi:hypothetical protein
MLAIFRELACGFRHRSRCHSGFQVVIATVAVLNPLWSIFWSLYQRRHQRNFSSEHPPLEWRT